MKNIENNRNKVRQVVRMKDGSEKVVFHPKKFHAPKYGSYAEMWKELNKIPKPNSKRQIRLEEERQAEEERQKEAMLLVVSEESA